MRLLAAVLLACLALPAYAWEEPQRGTQLRKDLMAAIRPLAENRLTKPVQFVIRELRHDGGVAYGALSPQRPGGAPIPWRETQMAARGWEETDNDGLTIHAFFLRVGDQWTVLDWSIGATDVWWHGSDLCVRFQPVIPEACP